MLGLGNPLLTDDSVGLRVVQQLRRRLAGRPGVEVDEGYAGGLRLMERLLGFDRAVLVDAICGGTTPGTVHVLNVGDVPTQHSASAHDVNLRTALALGRQAGAPLPATGNIRIVAIEAADVWTFGERCTPLVEESIGRAAEAVLALLAAWR